MNFLFFLACSTSWWRFSVSIFHWKFSIDYVAISLLKAYIQEWSKFYEQCEYLPKPFVKIETTINGNPSSNLMNSSDKTLRNTDQVRQLMLESWNNNIFKDIKHRLQVKFKILMIIIKKKRNIDSFCFRIVQWN